MDISQKSNSPSVFVRMSIAVNVSSSQNKVMMDINYL